MKGPIGRNGRILLAVLLLVLVVAGGATAAHYFGSPRAASNSSTATGSASSSLAPVYGYKVIETFPHSTAAFTEGLTYYNGSLYESTGLYGNSSLRRENLQTGQTVQILALPSQYFGEGITIINDEIIQLTWQNHTGFVYNLQSFKLLQNFSYPNEGWGLTNNGTSLIMSDGTANLYFLNPQTFQRIGEIAVHDGPNPVENLNSLQYINGSIFANVWLTNDIAVINPTTGQVTAMLDLAGIENLTGCHCDLSNDVLNGIAYDGQDNRLYVTGKDWPNLFWIDIVPSITQSISSPRSSGYSVAPAEQGNLIALEASVIGPWMLAPENRQPKD